MKTPEEKNIPSGVIITPGVKRSGGTEPKVLFPKGSKAKNTETASGGQTDEVQPKVLTFSTTAPKAMPAQPQPQAISPKVLFGKPTNVTHPIAPQDGLQLVKPAVILRNGMIRRRIEVTPYELRTTIAGLCEEAVVQKAIELVKTTNLDDGRDEKVMSWGSDSQRRLSSLLDEETRIVRSGVIEASKQEIAEIFEILQSLDLESISTGGAKEGLLTSLLRQVRGDDPITRFDAAYQSLQVTVKKLEARLPELQTLRGSAQTLVSRTKALGLEVEAAMIAGKYLTDYVRSGKYSGEGESVRLEEQMKTLDQRVESLASTQATLKMGLLQREFLVQTMAHIIDCVQNTLLVDIPAWRTTYLCVLSAISAGQQPDSSVFGQLMEKQNKILERIKI